MENQYSGLSDWEVLSMAGLSKRACDQIAITRDGLLALNSAHTAELISDNVRPATAKKTKAILELGRRLAQREKGDKTIATNSFAVYEYLYPQIKDLRQEVFIICTLDAKHAITEQYEISRGTLTSSLVHPREVFRPAIKAGAAAIICAHNHPSGDPKPSREDRALTTRLKDAGDLLGVQLLDHIVIGNGRYISFADESWMV